MLLSSSVLFTHVGVAYYEDSSHYILSLLIPSLAKLINLNMSLSNKWESLGSSAQDFPSIIMFIYSEHENTRFLHFSVARVLCGAFSLELGEEWVCPPLAEDIWSILF